MNRYNDNQDKTRGLIFDVYSCSKKLKISISDLTLWGKSITFLTTKTTDLTRQNSEINDEAEWLLDFCNSHEKRWKNQNSRLWHYFNKCDMSVSAEWKAGMLWCKVSMGIKMFLDLLSVFLILSLSVDRWESILLQIFRLMNSLLADIHVMH